MISLDKFVAIEPVVFKKVEAKVQNGLATIAQRTEVIKVMLKMDYFSVSLNRLFKAGKSTVILRGDSGLQGWNKVKLVCDDQEFVLCPIDQVIGFEVLDNEV